MVNLVNFIIIRAKSERNDFTEFNDYQHAAKAILPKMVYECYASGACDEITSNLNETAFGDIF